MLKTTERVRWAAGCKANPGMGVSSGLIRVGAEASPGAPLRSSFLEPFPSFRGKKVASAPWHLEMHLNSQQNTDSCHRHLEMFGRAGSGEQAPGQHFCLRFLLFCVCVCVFLPGAGTFEHLQMWRNNKRQESSTPLTGLRKNRTINAKLQPVEHRKWY